MKRVLISVYEKKGLENFSKALIKLGWEIIATRGTGKFLSEKKIPYVPLSEITKFKEILDGRVKTLHPNVLGGILALRERNDHMKELEALGIKPIDMIVVNLYPFKETISRDCPLEEALENIDIGGVSLIRAGAKNFKNIIVIVDPNDYSEVLNILKEKGDIDYHVRLKLATKAYQLTSSYDSYIFNYFNSLLGKEEKLPSIINCSLIKIQDLRYGENPHQKGALYKAPNYPFLEKMIQFQGKKLSFNNLLDINTAYELTQEFDKNFCCILKHNNPCGAAIGKNTFDAFQKALQTDPVSAFGGIIGFNSKVDERTASEITKTFFEVVVAPDYSEKALEIFKIKKNLRIISLPPNVKEYLNFKKITGGWLVQEKDNINLINEKLKVVTKRKPTEEEMEDLLFAWKIVKYVKSNAIVFAKNKQTLGIGAGQMSRVDSAKLAVSKANLSLKNSVVASDAFFPFPDALEECIKAGAIAVIQPGGSIRDPEVIETANKHEITMVLTGIRHFRH